MRVLGGWVFSYERGTPVPSHDDDGGEKGSNVQGYLNYAGVQGTSLTPEYKGTSLTPESRGTSLT